MSSSPQFFPTINDDLNGGQIVAIVVVTAVALVVCFGMSLCYCCWRHKRIAREKQDEWKRSDATRVEAGMVMEMQPQQLQPVANHATAPNPSQRAPEFYVSSSPRITFDQQQDALRTAGPEKKPEKSKYGSAQSLSQPQELPAYK
ncbi:hypothetical protein HDU98_009566 [Podochytrium sp. JEL0797]|nr:hypothetical protein HDU98_009566 [Podochytrium sp. JEL0797]